MLAWMRIGVLHPELYIKINDYLTFKLFVIFNSFQRLAQSPTRFPATTKPTPDKINTPPIK